MAEPGSAHVERKTRENSVKTAENPDRGWIAGSVRPAVRRIMEISAQTAERNARRNGYAATVEPGIKAVSAPNAGKRETNDQNR